MEKDLRREKEKLKTMAETPHLFWILGDMIEVVAEDVGWNNILAKNIGMDTYKIQLVERLKNKYEQYIRENEKPNGKQQLLGL